MGHYQDSKKSLKGLPQFIAQYEINMADYAVESYRSFNEFFIRKFKPGVREFNPAAQVFCAGAEARYLAVENISEDTRFPVKGIQIKLSELLGGKELAQEFIGGTLLIARLCPVDYHRFHFPVAGELISARTIHGSYHSVNPVALEIDPEILFKNERQVAILQNSVFGKVAMIEVGALGVGKIVQTAYGENPSFPVKFDKGQEKGYFLFGGSTVIWILPPGMLQLDADVVQNSAQGIEIWVPLGDRLGERK